jgi:hypothetical protein
MTMKRFSLIFLMLAMGAYLFAQSDEFKPMKYEGSTWYEVVLVNFKPGKVGDAKKIIEKYKEAGETAGTTPPEEYWFLTGTHDMMLIWEMEGGPSELEWKYSPESVKWWKAFVEQEGSEEAASELSEEYSSLIASSTRHFVRKDN